MKIKPILWVLTALAAFVFAGALLAQKAQAPTASSQSSAQQQQAPQMPETPTQPGNQPRTKEQAKQPQGPVPLTEKEVTKEIKSTPADTVIKELKERGVDFELTPAIEKKLRKANATDAVIEAVRQAGPKERANMSKLMMGPGQGAAQDIPKEQAQAYDALKVELDPDKAIGLVNDFATKYPNSPLLSYVYSFGANAYQQKGDVEKVVDYTNKSLQLKPDNLMSLIISIGMLPQPQYLNAHAADREKILQQAATEANHALELIQKLPKQPNESDADYQKRLAELGTQVHGPLGMVHLDLATEGLAGVDKAELAKAEQEYNTAVTASSHPDPRDYYRMGEAYSMDGKWDDAIQSFTKASELGQGTMIKTYADQQIAEVKKKKAAQGSAGPK